MIETIKGRLQLKGTAFLIDYRTIAQLKCNPLKKALCGVLVKKRAVFDLYANIYHFLAYEQLIIARSQSKYMEFIKETFGVTMSKILPENDKFEDDIHPLLSRLKSNFERKSKSEQNLN